MLKTGKGYFIEQERLQPADSTIASNDCSGVTTTSAERLSAQTLERPTGAGRLDATTAVS
jgi:hypothetical protein